MTGLMIVGDDAKVMDYEDGQLYALYDDTLDVHRDMVTSVQL